MGGVDLLYFQNNLQRGVENNRQDESSAKLFIICFCLHDLFPNEYFSLQSKEGTFNIRNHLTNLTNDKRFFSSSSSVPYLKYAFEN